MIKVMVAKFLTKKGAVILTAMLLFFIVSVIFYHASSPGKRFVFLYALQDSGKLVFENRYLSANSKEQEIRLYIEEMLLGPFSTKFKPLFSKKTTVRSCFVRKNALFVDLSDAALLQNGKSMDTINAVEIFKKNIFTNFKKIGIIYLYINGKEVYEDNL